MSDEYQPDDVVESQRNKLPENSISSDKTQVVSEKIETVAEFQSGESEKQSDLLADNMKESTSDGTPRIVNLADIDSSSPTKKSRIAALSVVGHIFQGKTWLAGVLIAVLVLVLLFLPPVSLGNRILAGGRYEVLNSDNPAVSHPDGLRFIHTEGNNGSLRVRLDTVPQAHFNVDMVSNELLPAVESLPLTLSPKSPYYIIDVKGKEKTPARIEIDIPNEAEPWDTLDLYSYADGQWIWVPSQLDRETFLIIVETENVPSSLMVMQNPSFSPRVAVEVGEIPTAGLDSAIQEADVYGLLIGTMGGTAGDATKLPLAGDGGNTDIVPIVRNWISGREPNPGLVKDMLSFDADRQKHIQELLGITESGGYSGLVLDYTGLDSSSYQSYTDFISDLSVAFHESGKWIGVVVDTPILNADGTWNTGGYDWQTLGSVVDQLRIKMPAEPEAYVSGGKVEQLLTWTVSKVNRNKVFLVYSTLSIQDLIPVPMDSIFGGIGRVSATVASGASVEPGTLVRFKLDTPVSSYMDVETGATELNIAEDAYVLGTPQWLQKRMAWSTRYKLGGVVLQDLYADGNFAGLIVAVADYLAQSDTLPYTLPQVNWQIRNPTGQSTENLTQLSQPQLDWTAPDITGTYTIMASVAGLDNGSINIVVSTPTSVVTDTLTETDDSEGAAAGAGAEITEDEDDEGEEATSDILKAGFVADVTVPDNTQFEKEEKFTKTWRLRNSGTVDWPSDTVLQFASGTQMTDVEQVEVGAVVAGEDVDISVEMTAPNEDGTFKSTWQLIADGKQIANGSVYVIIKAGEQPVAAPQPAAPVSSPGATGAFELGGHIRDLGIPYNDKMRYAGMTWVKTQIFYGQDAVGMVNAAHSRGYKIQLSAIGGAGMVTEAGYEQKFASWLGTIAASGADAIEVWNEPNIDREWQIGMISPQAYTNLLCASYNAIKAANPNTAVISAAPSPTGWFGGCGPNGCDDQPWMEGLWNAGAANCMDYIGAHHNAGATSPSARSGHPADSGANHHSWYFLPQTQLYYNIFRGTRQIFYTEMGYASQEGVPQFSDQFAWGRGTDNSEQASWLAEAVQLSINTGMVRCIIVWNIDFTRYGTDPQDGFAIIRPGGGCPACETLHNVLGTR